MIGAWVGGWLGAWVGLDADDFGDVQVICIRLGRGLAWSMGRLGAWVGFGMTRYQTDLGTPGYD